MMRLKIRRLHRWLGFVVGVQLLFWVCGGLVMSSFPLERVRGEHRVRSVEPATMRFDRAVMNPAEILATHPAEQLTLRMLLDRPVYVWRDGLKSGLRDAYTGARLDPLPVEMARQLALNDYAGSAELQPLEWVTEPALEYRGRKLPLWRAQFADALNTTLYISPQEGTVVARRNDMWRVFDFVWMLHIMDYESRENINLPWLIAFAASALLFTLSGMVLLWFSLKA